MVTLKLIFKLRQIFLLTLATSAFSLISHSVQAATIQFNSQGNIIGIKELEIATTPYNVNFVQSTFTNLFGNPSNLIHQPTFWLDAQGAEAARNAIDNLLETTYPASIAIGETQSTQDYLIPQQSALGIRLIDNQGSITFVPNYFGSVLGNYAAYYAGRKWSESLEATYQSGGICFCSINITTNPDIHGIDINATRTFALFSVSQTAQIPESSHPIGLIAMSMYAFFLRKKIVSRDDGINGIK